MNKRLLYYIIILGKELNLLVIVITRNSSASTWRHSTADLCQRNCCSSAKPNTIPRQRQKNEASGIKYLRSWRYLIISAIGTLPVGYRAGPYQQPSLLFSDQDPELGAPNFHQPCSPRYAHLRDVWETLSKSYFFGVCLFVVLKDRCVRKKVHGKR